MPTPHSRLSENENKNKNITLSSTDMSLSSMKLDVGARKLLDRLIKRGEVERRQFVYSDSPRRWSLYKHFLI